MTGRRARGARSSPPWASGVQHTIATGRSVNSSRWSTAAPRAIADRGLERQAQEELDAPAQDDERGPECLPLLVVGADDRRRVFDSPARGHGLARPRGAALPRRLVADGEDEVQGRRAGGSELIPALAAEAVHRQLRLPERLERERVHLAPRMTPRRVGPELAAAELVHDRLGDDAAGRVARAEEEHVVSRIGHATLRDRALLVSEDDCEAASQLVPDLPERLELLLLRAAGASGVGQAPVDTAGSTQEHRAYLLRAEGDDHIDPLGVDAVDALRVLAADVDADLVERTDGERVHAGRLRPGRRDPHARRRERARDPIRHLAASRIGDAQEQDVARRDSADLLRLGTPARDAHGLTYD